MNQKPSQYNILCIVCPEGCEMEIYASDGELVFSREICRRGQDYARQEIYHPCRVLTTTVRVYGGETAMLPVRTSQPIPKGKLVAAMDQIANIQVTAPIKIGEVICQDVANTGIALVACRTISNILSTGINCGFLLPTPTPPRRGIPLLGGVGVGS